ncbi:UFD1 protein [Rhizoctonia solani]|uniref:DNA-(apurinic or apyrimidinic site) lyase n=1 Tax=Rhizoctonia solani TaxID=456999 RepID=A0A8H7HCT6_9AGAM|nr:UFD1 protein [Rhizoctonia solani]
MFHDDDGMLPNPHGGLFAPSFGASSRRGRRTYDEYMKAYSMAMLPGRERANVSYGGKIMLPPSSLANLSDLDLESPWFFQLKNPSNQAATTHAGVLEFIAEEGCAHLPHWMMKTLRLNEGDPIRITNTTLPKGQFVKIQAQEKEFIEVSDPKAVLESSLRNFAALTQGDIFEIQYNMLTFSFLVMELKPDQPTGGGPAGINIIDTDLEVDFATPKGYVEPVRTPAAPPPTMAEKLKIDLGGSTPGSSRPGSSLGIAGPSAGPSADAPGGFDPFKGSGQTLAGRKTKGKGKSVRKIEEVDPSSTIIRTDKLRTMTTDDLENTARAPAPLGLPFGKLFFGYAVVPYKEPEVTTEETTPEPESTAFSGSGQTLGGGPQPSASSRPSGNKPPAPKPKTNWGKVFRVDSNVPSRDLRELYLTAYFPVNRYRVSSLEITNSTTSMVPIFKSIKLPLAQLNLKAVLKCGQSFRWTMVPLDPTNQDLKHTRIDDEANPHELPTEEWRLTLNDRVVCLRQTENELFYRAYFSTNAAPDLSDDAQDSTLLWLRDYFQLDIDLEALYADWSKRDAVFQKLAPRFLGIRILRQDPWENVVSFICSQNNHISRITSMVHSLCIHFSPPVCSSSDLPGSPLNTAWHSFPPPKALADPSVETKLRELGFGYRAKYIQKTATMLCEKHEDPMKALFELRRLSTSKARERLLELHGVGPKVADCILLMSLDKAEVVPVDTHVQQIATKMYGFKFQGKQPKAMNPKLYSEIASKFANTWGPYAGWAHSVLFTADLKSFANFGLNPAAAVVADGATLPLPSPAPITGEIPLGELSTSDSVKHEESSQRPASRRRKSKLEPDSSLKIGEGEAQETPEDLTLAERVKRRNHFLRSMAEPVSHEPEKTNNSNEVEAHFADTVSVVTEVNKIAEAPLIDTPLELTTKEDTDAAKANEQIRRSASRDRDMKDEEGLTLKAPLRAASEESPIAPAEVADGVKKLDISSPTSKKRKSQDETEQSNTKGSKGSRRGRKPGEDRDNPAKSSTQSSTSRRRNSIPSQNGPVRELRRSKRRKSTSSQ